MTEEPKTNDVIEYSPELDRGLAELAGTQGKGRQVMIHNLPINPRQQMRLLSRAQGEQAERLAAHTNTELNVRHFICHNVDMVNQKTGEVEKGIRTVLFTADGKMYQAVSEGVFQGIQTLLNFHRDGEIPADMRARVVHVSTSGANSMIKIIWDYVD